MTEKKNTCNSHYLKTFMESSHSLISFMEHSDNHWCVRDNEARYLYINNPAFEFFRFPKNFDPIGKSDKDVPTDICEELWPEFNNNHLSVIAEEKKRTGITIHYYERGNHDQPVPHLFEIAPLYNDDGRCIGTVSNGRRIDSAELLFYMKRLNRTSMKFDMYSEKLTPKEMEISFWLQQGLSYKAIAKKMSISNRTVTNRIYEMLHKTGTYNVDHFLEYCKETGLDAYIPSSFIKKGIQLIE